MISGIMLRSLLVIAIAGSILMVYRLRPLSSFFPGAWVFFILSIVLLFWGGWSYFRRVKLHVGFAAWSWLFIIFWLLIQTRFAVPVYGDALIFPVSSLLMSWALHVFGSGVNDLRRNQIEESLPLAFCVASIGTSLIQTLQLTQSSWLSGFVMPLPDGMQPFGNLAQRNQAAFVHVLGMLACAHLWIRHGSAKLSLRWWAMLLCLPMVWGLAMTASRLFLFMGGLAWVAVAWQLGLLGRNASGMAARVRMLGMGILLVMVYAACYFCFAAIAPWLAPEVVVFDNVVERLGNVSNQTRVVLQQQAWAMFVQSPLIGMGWGSFSAFALQWSDRSALPMFADHSHFLPSHWLAELGLVGVLVSLPLVFLILRCLLTQELWSRQFFLQSFVVSTLLYSLSEFPLWEGYFLLPFALALGLLDSGRRSLLHGQGIKTRTARISASWVALIGLIFTFGSVWSAKNHLDLHFLGAKIFTGAQVEPSVYDEIYQTSGGFGFSYVRELYLFVILPIDVDDLSDKVSLGERVASRYVDANILQRLGFFYALNDDFERSKRLMQDACRFNSERCQKILSDLLTVPQTESDVFRQMHAELTQWWSNHPRNPARPPG